MALSAALIPHVTTSTSRYHHLNAMVTRSFEQQGRGITRPHELSLKAAALALADTHSSTRA